MYNYMLYNEGTRCQIRKYDTTDYLCLEHAGNESGERRESGKRARLASSRSRIYGSAGRYAAAGLHQRGRRQHGPQR